MELIRLVKKLKERHNLSYYRIEKESGVQAYRIRRYEKGANYTIKTYEKLLKLYKKYEGVSEGGF